MSRNILIISFVVLLAAGNGAGSDIVNNMVESMLDGGERVYHDTVTGEQISQAKYSGNILCDYIKRISPYIYSQYRYRDSSFDRDTEFRKDQENSYKRIYYRDTANLVWNGIFSCFIHGGSFY